MGWKPFRREISKERVEYLAERRNRAVSEALSLFPEAEDILMVDSYYLNQTEQIEGLIAEYVKLSSSTELEGCILGASTWVHDKTRIRSSKHFFDGWTTPEGNGFTPEVAKSQGGRVRVPAVGACYIYPREVWEKVGYGVPEDLHGCEHNWLCEGSGLHIYLSLNEMLWHDPVTYSWLKRVRCSLHLGRFVRRTVRRNDSHNTGHQQHQLADDRIPANTRNPNRQAGFFRDSTHLLESISSRHYEAVTGKTN